VLVFRRRHGSLRDSLGQKGRPRRCRRGPGRRRQQARHSQLRRRVMELDRLLPADGEAC
jgi:hypothetical protein